MSNDGIYRIDEDGVFAANDIDGYSDFYKEKMTDKVWVTDKIPREIGPFYFSFDRKTVYNFWTDYEQLTDEQKAIFREEYPTMAALKEGYK